MKQAEVVDLIVEDGKSTRRRDEDRRHLPRGSCDTCDRNFSKRKDLYRWISYDSGPNGMAPSMELSDSLKKYGIFLRRFKTGTPARVDGKTLDYDEMTVQHGDDRIVPFSFMNELLDENRADCWLSYTNEETHEIIRNNFHRSALFTGEIEGVVPRLLPFYRGRRSTVSPTRRDISFSWNRRDWEPTKCISRACHPAFLRMCRRRFIMTIPGLEAL